MRKDQHVVVDLFERRKCTRTSSSESLKNPTSSSVSGHTTMFPVDSMHVSHRNRCQLSALLREIKTLFDVDADDDIKEIIWGTEVMKVPITTTSLTPVLLAVSPMEFERRLRKAWKRTYGHLGSAATTPPKLLFTASHFSTASASNSCEPTTDMSKAQRDLDRIDQLKSWLVQLQDILKRGSDADCYRGSALIAVSETRVMKSSERFLDAPPSPASVTDENSLILPPPGAKGKDAFGTAPTWGSVVDTITYHLNGTVVAHSTADAFVQGGDSNDDWERANDTPPNQGGSVPMVSTDRYDDVGIMSTTHQQQSARRRSKERSGARARSVNQDGSGDHRSNSGGSDVYVQQRSNAASRQGDNHPVDDGNDGGVNRRNDRENLVQGLKASMDALHYMDATALEDEEEEEVKNRRIERAETYGASNARFIQDMNQPTCVNCLGDTSDTPQLPHLLGWGGGAFAASSWPRDIVTRRIHLSRQLLASQESIMDVGGEDLEEAVLQLPLQIQVVGCFRIGCNAPAASTTTSTEQSKQRGGIKADAAEIGVEDSNTSTRPYDHTSGGSAPLNVAVDPKAFAEATVSAVHQLSSPFVGSKNMKRSQRERLKTDPGIVTLEVPNLYGDFCVAQDEEDEDQQQHKKIDNVLDAIYKSLIIRHFSMRNQRPSVLHKRPIVCDGVGGRSASSSSVVRVGCVYDCIDPPLVVIERLQSLERLILQRLFESEAIVRRSVVKKPKSAPQPTLSSKKCEGNMYERSRKHLGDASSPIPSQPPTVATQLALDDDRTPVRNGGQGEEPSPAPQLHSRRLSRRAGVTLGDTPVQLLNMNRINKVRGGFSPSTALTYLADQASLERINIKNNTAKSEECSQEESASPTQTSSRLAQILQRATQITKGGKDRDDDSSDDDKSSESDSTSTSSSAAPTNNVDSRPVVTRFRRHSAHCLNMCALWCAMLISPPTSGEHLLQLLEALREATPSDLATHPAFDTILGAEFSTAAFGVIRRIVLDDVNDLYDPSVIPTEDYPLGTTTPAMMASLTWVIQRAGSYRGSLFHFPLPPHQQQLDTEALPHQSVGRYDTPSKPPAVPLGRRGALPTTPRKQHLDADNSSVLSAGRMPTSLTATLDKEVKLRIGLFGCVTFADVVRKLQDETSLSIRSLYQRFVNTNNYTKRYVTHTRYLIAQQKHRSNTASSSDCGVNVIVDELFVGRGVEDLLVSPFLLTTHPPNAAIFPSECIASMLALCNHLHVESHVGRDPMKAPSRRAGTKARRSQPSSPYRSPRKGAHHQEDGDYDDDDHAGKKDSVDEVEGSVRESSSCISSSAERHDEDVGRDANELDTLSSQQPQTPISYLHRSMELDINTPVYLRGGGADNEDYRAEE